MPFSDPVRQRNYQREWVAGRRARHLAGHHCEWCGSTERLEIDHIDPSMKVTHGVWSWSRPRREAELAKCRVLCYRCHKKRHAASHGSVRCYEKGCRCQDCRNANRLKKAKWRARRKASKHSVRVTREALL